MEKKLNIRESKNSVNHVKETNCPNHKHCSAIEQKEGRHLQKYKNQVQEKTSVNQG